VSKSTIRSARRKQVNRKTPILVIVGGVLLLGLVAFFALRRQPSAPFQPQVTGAPGIQVDKEKVDLGQVKLGVNTKVSFKVTNVGDQSLRFTEAPYIELKEGC
jgi:MYXO-CTERM domain-containing protein